MYMPKIFKGMPNTRRLNGKGFVNLVSLYACAVLGIALVAFAPRIALGGTYEDNLEKCLRASPLCKSSMLRGEHIAQASAAAYRDNLEKCSRGSPLCRPTMLEPGDRKFLTARQGGKEPTTAFPIVEDSYLRGSRAPVSATSPRSPHQDNASPVSPGRGGLMMHMGNGNYLMPDGTLVMRMGDDFITEEGLMMHMGDGDYLLPDGTLLMRMGDDYLSEDGLILHMGDGDYLLPDGGLMMDMGEGDYLIPD